MSTVLHRRELHVAITAEEAGRELASSESDVQVAFFVSMAKEAEGWNWPMQCRLMVDEMTASQRQSVAKLLDTLVEHLKEPV